MVQTKWLARLTTLELCHQVWLDRLLQFKLHKPSVQAPSHLVRIIYMHTKCTESLLQISLIAIVDVQVRIKLSCLADLQVCRHILFSPPIQWGKQWQLLLVGQRQLKLGTQLTIHHLAMTATVTVVVTESNRNIHSKVILGRLNQCVCVCPIECMEWIINLMDYYRKSCIYVFCRLDVKQSEAFKLGKRNVHGHDEHSWHLVEWWYIFC